VLSEDEIEYRYPDGLKALPPELGGGHYEG
jgi:hypothetical protein